MYTVLFISAILVSPARLFPASHESRIYGGREANKNEFPWMVFIRLSDELNCSGFLISSSYVVTAAHCMIDRSVKDMSGVVGSIDREQNIVPFSEYIMHPDYNRNMYQPDVAILKFETPLELSDSVRPICIGKASSFTPPGTGILQMGWGRYRNDSKIVSKKLKVTDVGRIISEYDCNIFFAEIVGFSLEGRLCVMNEEIEGVCEGDSGGPLVYKCGNRYMAVGVDSIGFYANCSVTNAYPEIFTDVGYYAHWIATTVDEPICVLE